MKFNLPQKQQQPLLWDELTHYIRSYQSKVPKWKVPIKAINECRKAFINTFTQIQAAITQDNKTNIITYFQVLLLLPSICFHNANKEQINRLADDIHDEDLTQILAIIHIETQQESTLLYKRNHRSNDATIQKKKLQKHIQLGLISKGFNQILKPSNLPNIPQLRDHLLMLHPLPTYTQSNPLPTAQLPFRVTLKDVRKVLQESA